MTYKGKQFESDLNRTINKLFLETSTRAISWRHFEYKMNAQMFDIFVDSRGVELYLAIECKSIDYRKTKSLNFKHHFHTNGDEGQIPEEDHFLWLSGRAGIVAVELRNCDGNKKRMVLFEWPQIYHDWKSGATSIDLKDLSKYHMIDRKCGEWELSVNDLLRVNYLIKGIDPNKKVLRASLRQARAWKARTGIGSQAEERKLSQEA